MEDRNQHIDQYFRQQLDGYTEQPAPEVWAALEQRLDRKRKRVLWVWFSLLCLLATGGTAYYLRNTGTDTGMPAPVRPVIAASHTPLPKKDPATGIDNEPGKNSRLTAPVAQKDKPQQRDKTGITSPNPVAKQDPVAGHIPQAPASIPVPPVGINQRPLSNPDPLPPVELRQVELQKAGTEPDILQLLPTVVIDVPAPEMDEEEFQALAPSSGNKKAATPDPIATIPVGLSRPIDAHLAAAIPATLVETESPSQTSAPPDIVKTEKHPVRRFSAGLKTGYEFGTKPYHANSLVLSPYLQYNFSNRLGILLQPAFKYSHSRAALLSYGGYTRTTDSLKEVTLTNTPNTGGIPTSQDQYMAYQKTYDSIFIQNELRDVRYWNLDLPLMLSYKVHKNFSIYAGPAFHFTRVPEIVSNRQVYSGLVLNDTVQMERKPMSADFDTLDLKEVFPQQGFDISQYNGSPFDNPTINPFKMGVSFGLSYTFGQRFHFDILYRQALSKINYISNEKMRELLKQPYIRIMLGFDLLK